MSTVHGVSSGAAPAQHAAAASGLRRRHASAGYLAMALCCMLSGCSSMSGFDAKTTFACKAPDGVLCQSMTGIFANVEAKNLPGQRASRLAEGVASERPPTGALTAPLTSGTPIRSTPRVLRVWFAPWQDADGDLHDQSYVYLTVDYGDWLIAHSQRRIADAFQPVRAAARADQRGGGPSAQPTAKVPLDHAESAAENGSDAMRPGPLLPALPTDANRVPLQPSVPQAVGNGSQPSEPTPDGPPAGF